MKIPKNYFKAFNVLRNSRQVLIRASVFAALIGLSACGGGGERVGDAEPNRYSAESGLAQKGPLMQGSQITINELSTPNFQPTGRSFGMEVSSNDGKFNPTGIYFLSPYLSTTAIGYYFNEITGAPSNDLVFLRGLSDLSAGADTSINVNVLSGFSKNRIINLLTGTNLLNPSTGMAYSSPPARLPFANARSQAQAENLKAFYIYNSASIFSGASSNGVVQPANFTALDLGRNRAADQILAAISAVVMTAGQNGNGVNTLLSQIEADFADDGLLNNSPKYSQAVQPRLCAAAAITDFAAVAANLNKFYGTSYQATDLSQWVDTPGCEDQVINMYKFSASNVAVGSVSKSPAYIVGADDAGQCFSVGGITTGATAGLYYKGGETAVGGTQLVKAGDSITIGISSSTAGTYSGFIQRSAPATNGNCPTAWSTVKNTRVLKFSSDFSVSGTVYISGDDGYILYFNGELIGKDRNGFGLGAEAWSVSVKKGVNVIAVKGINAANGTHPGAIIAELKFGNSIVTTDIDWIQSILHIDNWEKVNFSPNNWNSAISYGTVNSDIWWNRGPNDPSNQSVAQSGFPVNSTAKWIWSSGFLSDGPVYFRKSFHVN